MGIKPFFVIEDTTTMMDNLYGRRDFYYGTSDRIFMVFQDRANLNGYLYDLPEIYKNLERKVTKNVLQNIEQQISKSGIIDRGKEGWETSGQLNGMATEFVSTDNEKYIFIGLHGGQVSNDHFPFYEFLFIERNGKYELIKKQRFYTDTAGIEGMEFAYIFPLFSFLLSVFGILAIIIFILKSCIDVFLLKNTEEIKFENKHL